MIGHIEPKADEEVRTVTLSVHVDGDDVFTTVDEHRADLPENLEGKLSHFAYDYAGKARIGGESVGTMRYVPNSHALSMRVNN